MKKVLKTLLLTLFFILTLIYFFPKENLYFLVEEKLQKEKIIISNETIEFNFIGFFLKDFDLYYDGIKVAKIENLDITYSFFDFNKILISSKSKEVGNLEGKFDLFQLKFESSFKPTNKIKTKYGSLLRKLKMKNGAYLYEYKL